MTATKESEFYIQVLRPWELLLNSVFYFLGAGLANYLGYQVNWGDIWKGLALVIFIQAGAFALAGVYSQMEAGYSIKKYLDNIQPGNPRTVGRVRMTNCLILSITAFTLAAGFLNELVHSGEISGGGYLFTALLVLLLLFFSIPPLRLERRGYGEVALTVAGAFVIPAIGFIFQTGGIIRILVLATFPLTFFYLAMEMVRTLRDYSNSPFKLPKGTMISRLGSDRGLQVIIYLILGGYLAAGIESLFGLSWSILWKILMTLPVGAFLVWQIQRLRDGARPNWILLEAAAIALVGILAYFLAFGFWTG